MNKIIAAAGFAALFSTAAAYAAPTTTGTSIQVSNIAFDTFDLTPGDGSAAGYSIHDVSTFFYTVFRKDWANPIASKSLQPTEAATLTLDQDTLHSDLAWSGTPGALALNTSSGAEGVESFAQANQTFTVRVTPHTVFSFSALATVLDARNTPTSRGGAGIGLYVYGPPGEGRQLGYGLELSSYDWGSATVKPDFSTARNFSVSYVNLTDKAQDLRFEYRVSSNATYAVAPVPEPATYAMLGVGLLAIGARRRSGPLTRTKGAVRAK